LSWFAIYYLLTKVYDEQFLFQNGRF